MLLKCLLVILIISSCEQKSPDVVAIYPSADTLPENLLRMYVQFSEPMKTVGSLEKIKLFSKDGREIKGAIFQNVYELWNEDQTQLTLIFDPARIKTGLQANENLGRALQPGQSYELRIGRLESVHHEEIKPFTKKFHVSKADIQSPNMDDWKLVLPKANTVAPLKIIFSEMIDHMSLRQRIVVANKNEELVKGEISITNEETEWLFIPNEKWKIGTYSILVNARLADPAGNNLNGLFDHMINSLKYEKEDETLLLKVEVK